MILLLLLLLFIPYWAGINKYGNTLQTWIYKYKWVLTIEMSICWNHEEDDDEDIDDEAGSLAAAAAIFFSRSMS